MARLSYHTTVLEAALTDMQRAQNSKRSIAEIALTRMCDPRLSASAEALVLRIEELEKQVAMMKMGVVTKDTPAEVKASAAPAPRTPTPAPAPEKKVQAPAAPPSAETAYSAWGRVLERVSEIRASLASQFIGAQVTRSGNTFTLSMREFFAARLDGNEQDKTIIKGAIAEKEGISPSEITLKIVAKGAAPTASAADELDKIFN